MQYVEKKMPPKQKSLPNLLSKTPKVDTTQGFEEQSKHLQPSGGLDESLKPRTGSMPPKLEKSAKSRRDPKPEKERGERKEGAGFKEVKVLSERNAKVYQIKTEDGRDLVLKYQGQSSTLDDYLLGCAGTAIGLKYPVDQISIHIEGSSEEKRFTQGLKQAGIDVTGSVTVMPLLTFTENKVAMNATTFTRLGQCFAYDVFIYGKDRFPISANFPVNNLFMQGHDPLMIDTPSSHSLYTDRKTHKASMREKLKHDSRKTLFNKLYAKAMENGSNTQFSKKVRSEMKQAFHAGIQSGMKDIFSNQDKILEHAKRVGEMNQKNQSFVLGHGVDKMLEDLREVLKAKKSMHSEGKVYKFLVGD